MRIGIRWPTAFVCLAWLATTAVALWLEVPRILAAADSPAGVLSWFFNIDADWSLSVLVLLLLPVIALGMKLAGSTPTISQPSRLGGRGWTDRSEGSPGGSGCCLPTQATLNSNCDKALWSFASFWCLLGRFCFSANGISHRHDLPVPAIYTNLDVHCMV